MAIRLRDSLTFRLALVGLVLAVVSVAYRLLVGVPYIQGQVQELVHAQQMSIANFVAQDVERKLEARTRLIEHLAEELPQGALTQAPRLQEWLREHQRLAPLFNSGLLLVRPDGRGLIAEYPEVPGRSQLDYSDRDWFRHARGGNRSSLGSPYRGRADGAPILIMAAPILDSRGQTLAVLAGVTVLNAPGFLDVLQENRGGALGALSLIAPQEQRYLVASDPARTLAPTPSAQANPLLGRALGGFRGSGLTQDEQGRDWLYAITEVPSTGWLVVAELPAAEAFRPADALRDFFIRNTVMLLAAVFLAILVLVPRLLRPLGRAAGAMRQMADGKAPLHPLPIERYDEVGEVIAGFNRLVEKIRQQEAHLAHMAKHDALTGLPNRALLEDRLEQALARAERSGQGIALLFCDLDGFKAVNDQYGHDVGDAVLIEVARRLSEGRRRADTVARLGGDEFVILLPDLPLPREAGGIVAEQCVAALRQPLLINDLSLTVGTSIGVALYPEAGNSASQLLSCADAAMYQAKREGKNRYAFLAPR